MSKRHTTTTGPRRLERAWAVALLLLAAATPATAQIDARSMSGLSLDSLLNVRISAAARYAQTTSQAAASVTVITAADIERFGYRTLDEALASVQGFYLSSDHNYSYIGVRGFSRPSDYNNRLLLLLNDQPMNEMFYQSIYGDEYLGLDLSAVERIEIVRGPASALYGSSAMFGVINIVTRKGVALDGAYADAAIGELGSRRARVTFGHQIGSVDLMASVIGGRTDGSKLYFEEFDSPESNNGVVDGLDWQSHGGFFTRAAYRGLSVQLVSGVRRKGIPTAAWETSFGDTRARTLDEQSMLGIRYEQPLGGALRLSAGLYGGRYHYHGWYPYEDTEYEDSNLVYWGGANAEATWDVAPNHRIIGGAEFVRTTKATYLNFTNTDVFFDGDFPFHTVSAFLTEEMQLTNRLTITGGVRADRHSEGPSAISPRLGAVFAIRPQSVLKVLYGEAFRAPSIYERVYEIEDYFERGPELDPERIRTTELVWEQRLSSTVRLTASAYHNAVRDLIDQAPDSVTSVPEFINVGRVRTMGLEAGLEARMARVSGYLSYGYQETKDLTAGEPLSNSPRHTAKLGAAVPMGTFGMAAVQASFEDSRRTLHGTETDPVVLIGLNAQSREFAGVRLKARVRNLFNVDHRVPGGYEHTMATIPQMPRVIELGLSLGRR